MKTIAHFFLGSLLLPAFFFCSYATSKEASHSPVSVTAASYCSFLNAVAQEDFYHLYDRQMSSDPLAASVVRQGEVGNYHYVVLAGKKNSPMTYVDHLGVTLYQNWLAQGEPTGQKASDFIKQEASDFFEKGDEHFCDAPSLKSNENTLTINKEPSHLALASSKERNNSSWGKPTVIATSIMGLALMMKTGSPLTEEAGSRNIHTPIVTSSSGDLVSEERDHLSALPPVAASGNPMRRPSDTTTSEVLTPEESGSDVTPEKDRSSSSDQSGDSILPLEASISDAHDLETSLDRRIAVLRTAANHAKVAAQYAKDVDDATDTIFNILDKSRAFTQMDELMNACINAKAAAKSATLAANNIESHLAQLECPRVEEFFDAHSYQNDSHLVAVELALQAVKKTTDHVHAIATSTAQAACYQERFDEMIAPLHRIDSRAPFEELLSTKKPISVPEPPAEIFATLGARQLTLEKAARRTEAAEKYANDIFSGIHQVNLDLEWWPDPDNMAKLKVPSDELDSTRSIANASTRDIRERLTELANTSHTEKQLQGSSQDDAKLIISAELAIKATEEAAKKFHAISAPILNDANDEGFHYGDWEEDRTKAIEALKQAKASFYETLLQNK